MSMMTQISAPTPVTTRAAITGLTAGTTVLTLAGAIPVEHLTAGDRIITRDGARSLRAIHARVTQNAKMVVVSASALGIEQPEEDMALAADQQILIRDWRAKALKGVDQAIVTAAKLIDGAYIRAETAAEQRLFTLEFDAAVVIYAGGLELACTPAKIAA